MPFFHAYEIIFVLGLLTLPVRLYVRKRVRDNPARQVAGGEDISYRGVVWVRYRNPGRLYRPGHWFYAKGGPIELIVRSSTFQVTAWTPLRRGRRYGWFLTSAEATMSLTSMLFEPFGRDQCIIVSGTYAWGRGQRQVDLAIGTRDRTRDIWNALAASGVKPVSGPAGDGPPPPPSGPAAGVAFGGVAFGAPGSGAPGSGPPGPPPAPSAISYGMGPSPVSTMTAAVGPGAPGALGGPQSPFPGPSSAAPTSMRARQTRRTVLIVALVFCVPLVLIPIVVHHLPSAQSDQPLLVTLSGPSTLATVTSPTCVPKDGEVDVTGFITATEAATAPNGLTVYTDIDLQDGETVGSGGLVHVPTAVQGQAQPFHFVVDEDGASGIERCNITWAATPAAATS